MLNRTFIAYAVLAFGLLLCSLSLARFALNDGITLKEFSVSIDNAPSRAISMPHHTGSNRGRIYVYEGLLHIDGLASKTLKIVPDDKILDIKINGKMVDLSQIPGDRLKDVNNGFTINLGRYLVGGDNPVEVTVEDYGGNVGLDIRNSPLDSRFIILLIVWLALFCLSASAYMKSRRIPIVHQFLYLLILVGAAVQVANIIVFNPVNHLGSDALRHWLHGVDVLRIDLMTVTDPIMYQLYMGLVAKITLKEPALIAYVTSLLALSTTWVWYKFIREITSRGLALATWAILSLLPSWIVIYSYFMQETLLLLLLGAALWSTWRSRRKGTTGAFALMVFLWVLAGLTRSIAIPLAAVCCSYLWFTQAQAIKKALVSSAILLLIMGPLTYRSYHTVSHFAPHAMGHFNILYAKSGKKSVSVTSHRKGAGWSHGFGSPSGGERPFRPYSNWQSERSGVLRVNVNLDKGTEDWDKAKATVDMDLKKYTWVIKEGLIFLFFGSSWPDNNPARIVDQASIIMRWIWAPLFIVVFVLSIFYWRRLKGCQLFFSMIIVWFVLQGLLPLAVNEGRYRKPFEGMIIVQAVLLAAAVSRRKIKAYPLDDKSIVGWCFSKVEQRRCSNLPIDLLAGVKNENDDHST